MSVMIRGQGTTDGFHEESVLIPSSAQRRVFGLPQRREPLAALSKTAMEYTGIMQNRVLKPAVFAFFQGGPEKIGFRKRFSAGLVGDLAPGASRRSGRQSFSPGYGQFLNLLMTNRSFGSGPGG